MITSTNKGTSNYTCTWKHSQFPFGAFPHNDEGAWISWDSAMPIQTIEKNKTVKRKHSFRTSRRYKITANLATGQVVNLLREQRLTYTRYTKDQLILINLRTLNADILFGKPWMINTISLKIMCSSFYYYATKEKILRSKELRKYLGRLVSHWL